VAFPWADPIARAHDRLGPGPESDVDQGSVGGIRGGHPRPAWLPVHPGGVSQGGLSGIEKDLLAVLAAEDLMAEVTRVAQDGPHGAGRPGVAWAMRVPPRIIGTRGRDCLGRQRCGNGLEAESIVGVEAKDATDHRGTIRVGDQVVQLDARRRLFRIRVVSRLGQAVSVGRAAPEPTPGTGVSGHCHPDAVANPPPLRLGQPTEEAHQQVVGLRVGIDSSTDLRYPQARLIVSQDREDQPNWLPAKARCGSAMTRSDQPRAGLRRSLSRRAASGRRSHGRDRD
jgi:hypothetical protein